MYIRKATKEDAESIELSTLDIAEFNAMAPGRDLRSTLLQHLTDSSVVLVDMGSVLAYGGNQGDNVWFLTSGKVDSMPPSMKKEFRRAIMEYRDKMLDTYAALWNYVWVNNVSHIRFLKTIGAVFHDDFCFTESGEKFQLFTITKEV